jgi:hypothetical protein
MSISVAWREIEPSLTREHTDPYAAESWVQFEHDFQWCQAGHAGEHVPERVADLRRNSPVKAVVNGEPTYEHTGRTGVAQGWWQG